MVALAGEPWRGLALVSIENDVAPNDNWRRYAVSITDIDLTVDAPTDQVDWEGTAGGSLTLRAEWNTEGAPLTDVATVIRIQAHVPGGAAVGDTWTINAPGASGSATRTLHFDSNPLNQVADAARAGTLELFIEIQRDSGVAQWGPADSRGTYTSPIAATHNDFGRGYVRAPIILSAHSISDVAINGTEPTQLVFPDSIHTRITLTQLFEAASLSINYRRPSVGTIEKTEAIASAGPNHDRSWTSTSTTIGRTNNGFVAASELKTLEAVFPTADFGGDNKFIYASSGHQANWTRVSDLIMRYTDRILADPRITVAILNQVNNSDFATPPLSLDQSTRLVSDLSFQSARFRNADTEGQNIITATLKNWDAGELTGTEASPVNTVSASTSTRGGEAGWMASGAGKLPLAWTNSLPGGSWITKAVITAPSDATNLETNNTRTLTLLSPDPAIRVITGGGPDIAARDGDHWHTGEPLLVGLAILHTTDMQIITADPSPAPTVMIGRFNVTLARAEYLDSDLTWKPTSGDTIYAWPLSQSPGDSQIWIHLFSAVETTGWGDAELFLVGVAYYSGNPYSGPGHVDAMSSIANAHDGFALDAVGLALTGKLTQR